MQQTKRLSFCFSERVNVLFGVNQFVWKSYEKGCKTGLSALALVDSLRKLIWYLQVADSSLLSDKIAPPQSTLLHSCDCDCRVEPTEQRNVISCDFNKMFILNSNQNNVFLSQYLLAFFHF